MYLNHFRHNLASKLCGDNKVDIVELKESRKREHPKSMHVSKKEREAGQDATAEVQHVEHSHTANVHSSGLHEVRAKTRSRYGKHQLS